MSLTAATRSSTTCLTVDFDPVLAARSRSPGSRSATASVCCPRRHGRPDHLERHRPVLRVPPTERLRRGRRDRRRRRLPLRHADVVRPPRTVRDSLPRSTVGSSTRSPSVFARPGSTTGPRNSRATTPGRPPQHRYGYTSEAIANGATSTAPPSRSTSNRHHRGPRVRPGPWRRRTDFVPKADGTTEDAGWILWSCTSRRSIRANCASSTPRTSPVRSRPHPLPQRVPFGFHGNWVSDGSVAPPA